MLPTQCHLRPVPLVSMDLLIANPSDGQGRDHAAAGLGQQTGDG